MSNNGLLEVQKKISEIENAIRERDINKGISAYNTLRIYASDPTIDFQTKKLAHDKGVELHTILVQMRQEILQNEAIQATNTRTINAQSAYADPMPLKGSKDYSKPEINFKTIILIIIIVGLLGGGTYLFMTSSSTQGCTVDGPFACKETSLKVSADNMAQNYVILKMDQSNGLISQINVTNTSQSLKNCNRVYIDKAYSLATNYQELKIIFDCKNVALSGVAADVTLSYKLNGKEQTSTVRLSTSQSDNNSSVTPRETPPVNTTNGANNNNNNANNGTAPNSDTTTLRTGDTTGSTGTPTGYIGGGGGGGGGGSSGGGSGISIDTTPPKTVWSLPSTNLALNPDGATFNITFSVQGTANGYKVLNSMVIYINGNATTCTNISGYHTQICTIIYSCPKNLMGTNLVYYAIATDRDTGTENSQVNNNYIVPDFIAPSVNISTSNIVNITSTPVNISGNASDNYLLSYVEYRVNNGTWHNITGNWNVNASDWTINANVRNGTNYLEVRATDAAPYNTPNIYSAIKTFTALLRPEFTIQIYNDSGLNTNWNDTSSNSNINLSDSSTSYNGSASISFNGTTSGILSLTKTNGSTINNIDGYTNLSFYINGTTNTSIIVRVRGDADNSMFPDINLSNMTGNNLTGNWTYFEINMTTLNPYRYPINRIEFVPAALPDNASDTLFYIYALKLFGKISDVYAPQLIIEYPANNSVINMPLTTGNRNITIRGNVTDDTYIAEVDVNVNGTIYNMSILNYLTLTPNTTNNWSGVITLNNDTNLLNITAYDIYGRLSGVYLWNVTLNWTPDTTSPNITINSGVANNRTNQTLVTLSGNSTDDINGTGLNMTLWRMNFGQWHNISSSTTWTQNILLINDTNFIEAISIDNSGNNATQNTTVYYNFTNMGAMPLIIYNDNNLTNNWTYNNMSIGQNVLVNTTEQVYSGNTSFKTDSNASGTLNLMMGSQTDAGINATNYTKVRFAIYANQSMNLYVQLGFMNLSNNLYYNSSIFNIPSTTWYIVNVNVSSLMNSNTLFNSLGLTINEASNVTYYLDNVQIVP